MTGCFFILSSSASLPIEKTKPEFNVSAYMVRQARTLVKENGILELPEQKNGKVHVSLTFIVTMNIVD
jgi:hypothetical protein